MHRDEYLRTLCRLGFPISAALAEQLDGGLAKGGSHFEIWSEGTFDDSKIGAKIHYYKKQDCDDYYILNYEACTKAPIYPFEDRKNSFKVNHGTPITLKEAFNLLQGRAILKDFLTKSLVEYSAWMELDFRERDISGNYREVKYSAKRGIDLEKAVRMYPIKELEEENGVQDLLLSLQRGDQVEVSFQKKRTIEKVFIEVNAKDKLLTIIPRKMIERMKKGKGFEDMDIDFEE